MGKFEDAVAAGLAARDASNEKARQLEEKKRADAVARENDVNTVREKIRPLFEEAVRALDPLKIGAMCEATKNGMVAGVDRHTKDGAGRAMYSEFQANHKGIALVTVSAVVKGNSSIISEVVALDALEDVLASWVKAVAAST